MECEQERIFALEGEVFQASLAAVKQDALVSTLRRQLELNGSRDALAQQPQFLTPRQTGFAAERSAAAAAFAGLQDDALPGKGISQRLSRLRDEIELPVEASTPPSVSLSPSRRHNAGTVPKPADMSPGRSCGRCRGTTPFVATPAPRSSARDRGQGGVYTSGGGNSVGDNTNRNTVATEEDTRRHSCGQPRTPTTDILRRLLYESTPKSSTSCAAESGGKTRRTADEEDFDRSDHTTRRSRNGRRLFAEGSTVLRACPAAADDVEGARRGPAALFSDPACGAGGVQATEAWAGVCSGVLAAREEGENGAGKATLLGDVKATVGKTGDGGFVDQKGGRLATGEVVLRERLLQARKEFSALRT